VITLHYVSI